MKVRSNQQLNLEDFFSRLTFTTLIEDFSDKENHMFRAQHAHQFTAGPITGAVRVSICEAFDKIWNAPEDSEFIERVCSTD
jgi:hypothetical protein